MDLKGKWAVTRDESHTYTVSRPDRPDIKLPGTTGILDIVGSKDKTNRLMGWAKKQALLKVADHIREFSGQKMMVDEAWIEAVRKSAWKRDKEKLKEAGDIGTEIHAAIDEHIAGRAPKLTDKSEPGFRNFLAWQEKSGIRLVRGDTYVASLRMGYGGAADALGAMGSDSGLVLLDWKTGNSLYDTAALQVAAYAIAAEEQFDRHISSGYVVRFGKEIPGDIEVRRVNMDGAREAWGAALALYKSMRAELWEVA